jgi:hypothetical protein
MRKKVVFRVEYGGLGDHLFYSPLPRLLKEQGLADEVYISSQSNFRNQQTFDLVWKLNPYLDGIINEPPTPLVEVSKTRQTKIINVICEKFGIHVDQELVPEVYATLCINPSLQKKFIDLNYISYTGAFCFLDKWKLYRKHSDHVMVNPDRVSAFLFPKMAKIYTKSLMEYVNLINSSSAFIAVVSGGATLAAALKKPATIYYGYGQKPLFRHGSNDHIQVGGDNFFRKRLSRYCDKRNARRIRRSRSK